MPQRLRRFIGALLLLLSLAAVVIFAMAIAVGKLADQSGGIQLLVSFSLAVFWTIIAVFIIKWMNK